MTHGVEAAGYYPPLGVFADALSRELNWPAVPTSEENFSRLRAEKIIPAHLHKDDPATPTVVMATMKRLLAWSVQKGMEPESALSAMIRAAVATQAPIPTLPPSEVSHLPMARYPAFPFEIQEPPQYLPVYPIYPVYPGPVVVVPKSVPPRDRAHKRKGPDSRRQEPVREFPRTIFPEGESPAEKGPGIFPRH